MMQFVNVYDKLYAKEQYLQYSSNTLYRVEET